MRRTSLRSNPWQYRGAILALTLAWLAVGGAAQAAEVTVNAGAARPTEAPTLEMRDDAVQLSLARAVEIALQQNLGLVIERYTRTQQRLAITGSLGLYDLLANADVSARDAKSPTISSIEASASNSQQFNFSFTQRVPTGGDVSFGWNNSRSESNSPVFANPTFYDSGFTFAYSQPLLRNFGRLATEREILVAQTNNRVSRQEFERQVTLTVQQVEDAYWNLVGARQQLVVAQESLGLARELHDRNRIQVEVGTMAPLELVQSEAAIAVREEDIIRATSAIGDAEDALRQLLNLPTDGDIWQKAIQPTTPPETERISIDLNDAIATAFAERPELKTEELRLAQARLDADFFRNQLKPSLNLNVNYGTSGIGLRFGDAFDQVTGLDFRGWFAQLQFGYPIQNRAARAQSASANLDVERAQTVIDQQKTAITTEVRRAARAVDTAVKQIDAARISREFQEKNLEAERKRYENGMSTSFQITEIQEDVTQARSNEVTATIAYRTALAEYYRAVGRLLEQQGVAIDDPEEPDYASRRFSFSREPLPGETR
jgi:outer membrane protein